MFYPATFTILLTYITICEINIGKNNTGTSQQARGSTGQYDCMCTS